MIAIFSDSSAVMDFNFNKSSFNKIKSFNSFNLMICRLKFLDHVLQLFLTIFCTFFFI